MACRITVVLEYPSWADIPRIGANTRLDEMGLPKICSLQFSDALKEMEVLEDAIHDSDVLARAHRASYDYPNCDDPRRPKRGMT